MRKLFRRGAILLAASSVIACGHAPPAPTGAAEAPLPDLGPLGLLNAELAEINQDLAWVGGHPLFVFQRPTVRYFIPPARCGQGPYEIRVPAAHSDWIELWAAYALSPRALRGYHDSSSPLSGSGSGSRFSNDAPDNARCALTASEQQEADRAAARLSAPTEAVAAGRAGPPGGVPRAPGDLPPGAPTRLREIPRPDPYPRGRRYDLGAEHWTNRSPDGSSLWKSNAPEVIIRIWFDAPNDLEGVVFVVEHATATITIPEADFVAQARAERQRREDKRLQEEATNKRLWAEREARDTYCDQHHDNRDCWPNGYEQEMARRAEARRKQDEEVRERQEAYRRRAPDPPPSDPDRPPPAPEAETQPPRPSPHATWVAGYWHWLGGRWIWLSGRWRVPADDVARDLTVHAPSPPPAPRAEPRPQPVPELVWAPGFWQWDGARWIWIAGAWQRPPAPGATWLPDRWEIRPRGAVFLPGGWRIELRVPR
jgi:hypothetical protein